MKSKLTISRTPPMSLKGHPIAGREWRRIVKLPDSKITALDSALLAMYCLCIEEEKDLCLFRGQIRGDSIKPRILKTFDKHIQQKRDLIRRLARSLYLDPPNFS